MARSKANAEIVNTVSRLLVRGGYSFDGFIDWGRSMRTLSSPRRKRFTFRNTGQRASVGSRTTYFYSLETKETAKIRSRDLDEVQRTMDVHKALVGYGA